MEYAGNLTQRVMNRIMLSLHAYLAGGGCMVNMFCEKPIFPYNKGIYFIELSWWLLNIENGKPHLNPI